ncbi:hypothetical protein AAMO2058_001508000 [Amorphochlora amoebiformis]
MPRREAWNSPSPTPGMFGGSSLRHQPTAENAPPRMKTKIKKVIVEQKKNVWRGRMEQQKAKARFKWNSVWQPTRQHGGYLDGGVVGSKEKFGKKHEAKTHARQQEAKRYATMKLREEYVQKTNLALKAFSEGSWVPSGYNSCGSEFGYDAGTRKKRPTSRNVNVVRTRWES